MKSIETPPTGTPEKPLIHGSNPCRTANLTFLRTALAVGQFQTFSASFPGLALIASVNSAARRFFRRCERPERVPKCGQVLEPGFGVETTGPFLRQFAEACPEVARPPIAGQSQQIILVSACNSLAVSAASEAAEKALKRLVSFAACNHRAEARC
jgi:hypothetical protein